MGDEKFVARQRREDLARSPAMREAFGEHLPERMKERLRVLGDAAVQGKPAGLAACVESMPGG